MTEVDALDVYLHGGRAGLLERRSQARLRFAYSEQWVAEEGRPLSLSLPFDRPRTTMSSVRRSSRGFFPREIS